MRVHEQFESFMGVDLFQMDHQMIMAVLRTLAKIGPRADPVFRDKCEEWKGGGRSLSVSRRHTKDD